MFADHGCFGRHAVGGRVVTVTGGGYSQASEALGSLNLYHAGSCRYPHGVLKANSSM